MKKYIILFAGICACLSLSDCGLMEDPLNRVYYGPDHRGYVSKTLKKNDFLFHRSVIVNNCFFLTLEIYAVWF